MLVILAGCGRSLRTDYGSVRGVGGDESINGFGALRRAYESTGWSTQEVSRLNDRLSGLDAILWVPTVRDTIYDDAIDWFEEWLAAEPRTLIYVVPDGGCETNYLEVASKLAPPEQRFEYRRRLARLQTDAMLEALRDSPAENRWFSLKRMVDDSQVGGDVGEWNGQFSELPQSSRGESGNRSLRIVYEVLPPATLTNVGAGTPSGSTSPSPTSSTSAGSTSAGSTLAGSTSYDVEHEVLLSTSDGSPAIVRLTSGLWGESEVIVVGSGSMVSNFSLTTPLGQQLAAKLIEQTGDQPGSMGVLSTAVGGAAVSDQAAEINAVTGMELFSVWPLSLIMLHLAVLGIVACMILLPIFGRPRESETASSTDFRDHIDAVAALMSRSGGEDYARRRVSDYMRRIRGETSGPWVMQETKPPPPIDPSRPVI
jgi:hypothetical protein